MKWINKGHEYDAIARKWSRVKEVYLYGGLNDNGKQIIKLLSFLDLSDAFDCFIVETNIDKRNSAYRNNVISLQDMLSRIFSQTMNSYVVVDCTRNASVVNTLLKHHKFKYEDDVFTIGRFERVFLPVYMWYAKHKAFCYSAAVHFSTRCNLRCKDCMVMTPMNHVQKDRTIDSILEDVDVLFSRFDYVYRFGTSGGEPFLFEEMPEVIDYVRRYSGKLYSFGNTTNSTIAFSEKLAKSMADFNKESVFYKYGGGCILTIDDYSDFVCTSNPDAIKDKCVEYSINYTVNKYDCWIDTHLFKDDSLHSEDAKIAYHDMCDNTCWWLYDKKLYTCSIVLSAYNIGSIIDDENNSINIETCNIPEFIEFQSGFTNKGYFDLCGKCKGYIDINKNFVKAGAQV